MQRQGTYFPVLNKEDRAIALSAYTFPGRAEWLGWGVRTAGKLCMQEKKPKSHLWILKLTTFNVSLELMWFFCESQSNQGSWSSKKAVKIQKSLFSPLSLMKQVQILAGVGCCHRCVHYIDAYVIGIDVMEFIEKQTSTREKKRTRLRLKRFPKASEEDSKDWSGIKSTSYCRPRRTQTWKQFS